MKYSLKKDINGDVFVDVTENIFDAANGESVARTIQRVIAERFHNIIVVHGQKIQINKKTNDEFRRSNSSNGVQKYSSQAYTDKLKTIANADEILSAARNWIGEEIKHQRKDDIVEFARAHVMYRVGTNGYIADVLVGTRKNGAAVLYDIVNIYEKTITEAPVTMASDGHSQRRQDASVDPMLSQQQQEVKRQFSLSPTKSAKTAEDHFGATYNINEAGYLLTNGKFLDFSGKHDGAPGGYRTVDHRDIVDAFDDSYGGDSYSGGMIRFMQDGNIRLSPESGGINISIRPNNAQLSSLDRYISYFRGEVILDIDDANGDTVVSLEYPKRTYSKRIINDIIAYFDKGEVPEAPSNLNQFLYSLSKNESPKRGDNAYGQDVKLESQEGDVPAGDQTYGQDVEIDLYDDPETEEAWDADTDGETDVQGIDAEIEQHLATSLETSRKMDAAAEAGDMEQYRTYKAMYNSLEERIRFLYQQKADANAKLGKAFTNAPAEPAQPVRSVAPTREDIARLEQNKKETSSIKEQIIGSQDMLNQMEPVANVSVKKEFRTMEKSTKQNWVADRLRSSGYQVERRGLGIEIGNHKDHKDREYGTVTIAAPIIANGNRGNMAVVVKRTSGNFYKVHRILSPDGTLFVVPNIENEAEPTAAGESPQSGSLATLKGSTSKTI